MSPRTHIAVALVLAAGLQSPAAAVVIHDGALPRPVCGPASAEDAARAVRDFVDAYNGGDLVRLDEVFSPEPDFEWYTVSRGARQEVTAYDRTALRPYFARRHVAGDRLKLLHLDVGKERGWHGGFDFAFRLASTSAERRAQGRYHGKGAADCTIFVWSMGGEK